MSATDPSKLAQYLTVSDPSKAWVAERLIYLMTQATVIPSFSAAAIKLGQLARDENATVDDLAAVIEMDPGLASRCVQVASSAGYAARRIASIHQALMLLGMNKIRQIAYTVGVMGKFTHLKAKVDWDAFWMHSILVARLTDRVASAFRPASGSEYLAGLLHDSGKLVLEHYFPDDFDRIVLRATERACGHAKVEHEFIGMTHAQIGAAVCECLQAHVEVLRAVWFHHDPFSSGLEGQPDASKFLAACVAVGDALANMAQMNIAGAKESDVPFDQLPEWVYLNQFQMSYGLDLDLEGEMAKTREDLSLFVS
jgi:HD-like signal output (HDOD) protein